MGLRQWVQGLGFMGSRYWDIGRGFRVLNPKSCAGAKSLAVSRRIAIEHAHQRDPNSRSTKTVLGYVYTFIYIYKHAAYTGHLSLQIRPDVRATPKASRSA